MEEKKILDRKAFFSMAATLSLPIMIQNLISTLVGTADTLMMGYVGQSAMSASSLANNVYTVFWMAVNGLATGAAVLGSQYWGKKDSATIESVLGLSIRFCMGIAMIFFVLAFGFPSQVMHLFSSDPEIISEGSRYLHIVSFSYLFGAFSMAYLSVMRSVEKVKFPSFIYITSLIINVCMNATFIFGFFGLPKLGIAGVALGTVIARAFECFACMIHSCLSSDIRIRIGYVFAGAGILMQDFLRLSLPSFINDVVWSLAFSTYFMILGHMGSDAVAANAITQMALNIGAIVCRGFGNATTIIVGKALGENDIEKGRIYAGRMMWITFIFACFGGLVIIAVRPVISWIYADKLTEMALYYFKYMMLMQAYHLVGEALNTCMICGCFRGGGDTKFGMILDTVFMWAFAVPLMAICAFVLKLPVLAVYGIMCLDEFEKMLPAVIHYRKYNWLKNITRET